MENDCLFCKISRKEIPSTVIYEDEDSFAFLDIKPMNDGHTLVIPKRHATDILTISEEDWLKVTRTVHMVAQAVERALAPDGINIVMNNRMPAGQVIFHAHVHIIPRIDKDGHLKAAYKKDLTDEDAENLSNKIRAQL